MKKLLMLLMLVMAFVVIGCSGDDDPDPIVCEEGEILEDGICVPDPNLEPDPDPLTVAEVLELPDLTLVEFEAIVSGFDAGKRHIVLEDPDGVANIQLFRSLGYPQVQVGDKVLVTGFRTFDRSTDRIAPETLEVLSSGHPTSRDNPIVIDVSELEAWTNENRTNEDILFRWYTFTNVPMLEITTTYWYIDNDYDDEPEGRGLKIGVKDTSFVSPEGLFIVGETYTITALLYGSSDDFFDEGRDGTVMRLSLLSAEDVIHHVEEPLISMSGRTIFLVGEEAPNLDNAFTVVDPTDGPIATDDIEIEYTLNMEEAGIYEVSVSYERSNGLVFTKVFEIEVKAEGSSVSEALAADVGTEMLVEGVVIGYGLRSNGRRVPIVLEDPNTGDAIEMWTNSDAYAMIQVGDRVVIYSGATTLEKGQPRLNNHQLIKIVSQDNPLTDPIVIEDLAAWLDAVVAEGLPIFGRYTFTAEMVDATSSNAYKYFRMCEEGERCLQFGVHQDSAANIEWIEGATYTVTGVIYGVSDPISVLDNEASSTVPTIRFGIMDEDDVVLIP